jgi:hypothetical protein
MRRDVERKAPRMGHVKQRRVAAEHRSRLIVGPSVLRWFRADAMDYDIPAVVILGGPEWAWCKSESWIRKRDELHDRHSPAEPGNVVPIHSRGTVEQPGGRDSRSDLGATTGQAPKHIAHALARRFTAQGGLRMMCSPAPAESY